MPFPDSLCYEYAAGDSTDDYLVFFIPGNPGLISYYSPFLSTLSSLLAEDDVTTCVYGHSLAGFAASSGPPPLGLLAQILHMEDVLHAFVDARRRADGRNRTKAILVGHSVGAYILLELVRRHRSSAGESRGNFDIVGGVLLFPTVVDIAKSALGLRFAGILRVPSFALAIGALVYLSVFLIPMAVLYRLVKLITGLPEHAVKVSTEFIKSPMGVRQTLHLARDEMEIITDDKWGKEIWTSTGPWDAAPTNPQLVFYFGKYDGWVSDTARDNLISTRVHDNSSRNPRMLIDEDSIPHSFCLRHSELMAEKVKVWIKEITNDL